MAWTFMKPFGDEGRQLLSTRRRARRLKSVLSVAMMARRCVAMRGPQSPCSRYWPGRHRLVAWI